MYDKILIPVIIILIALPLASSQEIDFYKSDVLISSDTVKFSDTVLIPEDLDEITVDLFFKIQNFREENTFSKNLCKSLDTNFGSRIYCDFKQEDVGGRIVISYETNNLVNPVDGKFIYKNDFKVPLKTKRVLITVKLDKGFILIPEDNELNLDQYSPVDGVKGSDGRRIYVFWEREDVGKGDGISTYVVFEPLEKEGIDSSIFMIFTVFVAIIVTVFAGIYYKKHSGIKLAVQVLKDDERKVVEILQNSGGQAKQRQIQLEGDFSKATLSRLIKNLEERGLVRAERVGRTKRVYLNKEFGNLGGSREYINSDKNKDE